MERRRFVEAQTHKIGYQTMDNLQENGTYKYLDFQQSIKLDHTTIKNQFATQYEKRLKQILKTYLNSKNLTKAPNTYVCYTHPIILIWDHT